MKPLRGPCWLSPEIWGLKGPELRMMTQEIERRIHLEGAVNFRDLGGYLTDSGRTVKWRRIFRSDSPSTLTPSDVRTITETLGIKSVVDLRSSNSILDDGRGLLAVSGLGYHNYPFLERRGIEPPTCLLYTSPSPRDATLSRMPSSA